MRLPSPPIRRHLCACASRLYTPRMPCRNSQFVLRFVPDLALSDECRARPRVVLVFDPGQGAADTSEIVPRHALYRLLSAISRLSLGYLLATSWLPLGYSSSARTVRRTRQDRGARALFTRLGILSEPPLSTTLSSAFRRTSPSASSPSPQICCGTAVRMPRAGRCCRRPREGRQMWPIWPINIAGMAEIGSRDLAEI